MSETLQCPKCATLIPAGNAFCGKCGASVVSEVPQAPVPVTTTSKPDGRWCPKCKTYNSAGIQNCTKCGAVMNPAGCVKIGCISVVALALLMVGCLSILPKRSPNALPTELDAKVMGRQFVRRLLKAPSTADFSNERAVQSTDLSWHVSGSVDSQNSFGAMLRSTYVCHIKYLGNDEWQPVEPCVVQ